VSASRLTCPCMELSVRLTIGECKLGMITDTVIRRNISNPIAALGKELAAAQGSEAPRSR